MNSTGPVYKLCTTMDQTVRPKPAPIRARRRVVVLGPVVSQFQPYAHQTPVERRAYVVNCSIQSMDLGPGPLDHCLEYGYPVELALPSGQAPAGDVSTFWPKRSLSNQAWPSLSRILWVCKLLVLLGVLWVCVMGRPYVLFIEFPVDVWHGLYQGFVHGWFSECADWYTCGGGV